VGLAVVAGVVGDWIEGESNSVIQVVMGQLLVWWPSFSHSAQGGGMCGGSGAVGSFFFLLPPAVAGGLVSGG
jgi:hypothetical protein